MNEYYCPSKKAYSEHDKECYYHGPETSCPLCGTKTIPVKQGTYKPIGGYTKEQIIDSMLTQNITNYGSPTVNLNHLDYEQHEDGSLRTIRMGGFSVSVGSESIKAGET